jgi:hypothetical protein
VTGSHARPHKLLDPDLEHRPAGPHDRVPAGMSVAEAADRIVAKLLQGSGPILLCVPGTLGGAYETSMLALARAFVRTAGGPVSVSSIPYPNGAIDCVTRYLHIGTGEDQNLLAQVLKRLRQLAPQRPVVLAGESQGAWLIADTLNADPTLAAMVSRVVTFALPGFVHMPASIGSARQGAATLRGGATGDVEYRHTDDIVPSLFGRLHPGVFTPYLQSLLAGRGLAYPPHHYDWHGEEAARWLALGERPTSSLVHASTDHPPHPERV